VQGLQVAWRRAAVDVVDRDAVVVGAGGAARAVVVALARAGARSVLVYARNPLAAEAVVQQAHDLGLTSSRWNAPVAGGLVVLATSTLPDAPAALLAQLVTGLPAATVVHDLQVGPAAFLARNAALRAGHTFLDGTTLLLAQAQAALTAFLGESVSRDVERALLRGYLSG
jgi:shikimate dehydrogenase